VLIRLSSSGTLKFRGDNTVVRFNRTSAFAFFLFTPLAFAQGAPGQITKFGPDGMTPVDSVASEDAAGNIGIGTMTPAAKLDILGAM